MVTAVDSSVLLDVLVADPKFGILSGNALREAQQEGALIVCETVVAEILPALHGSDVYRFLSQFSLNFVAASQSSAVLAGEMYANYLNRGGKRGRILADFLIGAHAQLHADRLLARDYGYYRDYFKRLTVWEPS